MGCELSAMLAFSANDLPGCWGQMGGYQDYQLFPGWDSSPVYLVGAALHSPGASSREGLVLYHDLKAAQLQPLFLFDSRALLA